MNNPAASERNRRKGWTAGAMIGAAFLGAAAFGPVGAEAKEKALDVIVGNDEANPVVVSGAVTGAVDANITNTVPITGTISGAVDATVTNTVPITGTVEVAGPVLSRTEREAFTCRVEVVVPAESVGVSSSNACPGLTSARQFVITQSVISAFAIPEFPPGSSVNAWVSFFHEGNSPADAALAFGTVRDPDVDANLLGYDGVGQRLLYGSEPMETWLHPDTYSARVRISTNFVSNNDTGITVLLSGYSFPHSN